MAITINDYENVEVFGDFKPLPIGAHICKIVECGLYTGKSGKTTLRVAIDVSEGEYKDYFKEIFDKDTNADKKWSNNACRYLSLEVGKQGQLKGLLTAVNNSNSSQVKHEMNEGNLTFEESDLIGKLIGGVFGLEEYINNEGELKTANKLRQFRSVEELKNVPTPDVIIYGGDRVSYDDYMEKQETKPALADNPQPLIKDEDLPF